MEQTLPTYTTWLENEGITLSKTRNFTPDEPTSALQAQSVRIPLGFLERNPRWSFPQGFVPVLDCRFYTQSNRMVLWFERIHHWRHICSYHSKYIYPNSRVLKHPVADAPKAGSCPSSGIKYPPKLADLVPSHPRLRHGISFLFYFIHYPRFEFLWTANGSEFLSCFF